MFRLAGLPCVRRSWGDRFADYLACNVLTGESTYSKLQYSMATP
jgi:hypothetical protein